VSMVGVLGGAVGGLDFMTMFKSQATFRPIAIGSRRDLEEVCRVMKQHGMRPVIDSVFSFDDAAAALHHFADRQLFGKVVIRH
jgi:NADPH:quinone reductase-like Zn-dependent oxidoreductase